MAEPGQRRELCLWQQGLQIERLRHRGDWRSQRAPCKMHQNQKTRSIESRCSLKQTRSIRDQEDLIRSAPG
jgi:hypothetical protein